MSEVKSAKRRAHQETRGAAPCGAGGEISAEERYRMIAEAAYYRAVKRAFVGGDTVDDWLEA